MPHTVVYFMYLVMHSTTITTIYAFVDIIRDKMLHLIISEFGKNIFFFPEKIIIFSYKALWKASL